MRIPDATYRIQFNSRFGFRETSEILIYLRDLGISDLYASPIFEAVPGSSHGYDICNHDRLNPELGAPGDFEALCRKVRELEMGWIQDIVPNHAAFAGGNRRLMDALENEDSFYRTFFDIDWDHLSLKGKVLAPFLGKHYAPCLESGELDFHFTENGLSVRYYDLALPLKPDGYPDLLQPRPEDFEKAGSDMQQDYLALSEVLKGFERRGPGETADRMAVLKRELWDLYRDRKAVRDLVDARICPFQGKKKSADALEKMDVLLRKQNYRLAFWKNADSEINYRRFFLINGLIGLHAEDQAVFLDTHALVLKLVRDGSLTGLRIDHVDGLYNPGQYLDRLREAAGDLYLMVEKILDTFEELPSGWPIQGTTGYEFLNWVNGLFCDERSEDALSKVYRKISEEGRPYRELLRDKRRLILEEFMAGDLDNHARSVRNAADRTRFGRDFTLRSLRQALGAFLVSFPVYRSYAAGGPIAVPDRNYLLAAFEEARLYHPDLLPELSFLESMLIPTTGECSSEPGPAEKEAWTRILMRIQQITGSLMAKGLEDTVFYLYNRLISLNEVGGNPGRFGMPQLEFHRVLENRLERHPHALNATSTHDSKRGEDARARINVLSEIPDEWQDHLRDWMKINRRKKKNAGDLRVPEGNAEYFLYQSLVGGYPFLEGDLPAFIDRTKEYMIKAAREAKKYTSWSDPVPSYEKALTVFIDRIFEPGEANMFLPRFRPFQKKIAFFGALNSLSQTLIKITAPGIPDFYRGTELWDLTFVDPDNRGPVDFEGRTSMLAGMKTKAAEDLPGLIRDIFAGLETGLPKLFLIWRALQIRRERRSLFQNGNYQPARVEGSHENHLIAFQRSEGGKAAITVAPRFLTGLVPAGKLPLGREVWADTALVVDSGGPWREAITGEAVRRDQGRIYIGDILKSFPAGLLIRE